MSSLKKSAKPSPEDPNLFCEGIEVSQIKQSKYGDNFFVLP